MGLLGALLLVLCLQAQGQAPPLPLEAAAPAMQVLTGPPTDSSQGPVPPPIAATDPLGPGGLVPESQAAGPVAKIHFYGTEPGWVMGVEPVYTMLPRNVPWRIRIASGNMNGMDPSNTGTFIPPIRIQVHELKSDPLGTKWVNCTGTSFMRSTVGDPDGWLYLEFRVLVEWADRPGHYMSNALMYFECPGFNGQIPMELHLNLSEMFEVEMDADLEFQRTEGNYNGWMYTTTEGKLTVRSNLDFNLSVSAGIDLTGPDTHTYEIETAFRLRQPIGTGALWSTWGDLGDDESGHGTPTQWTGPADPGSPWPGPVSSVSPVTTQGVNEIGIKGAAWRKGVEDLAGDYDGTLTITVSPMP